MTYQPVTASLRPIQDDLMEEQPAGSPAAGPADGSPADGLTWPVQASPIRSAHDALPAAWEFSARRKHASVAWTLWSCAAVILLWFPALDAYLRSFGSFAVKLVLWLGGAVSVAIAVLAAPPVGLRDQWLWGTTTGAVITGSACLVLLVLWWLVDGLRMNSRLRTLDAQLREQIIDEHGADPYAVPPAL